MEEHREMLQRTFDDYRRSTALMQLEIICAQDLLKPEELARFSPEALAHLRQMTEVRAEFKKLREKAGLAIIGTLR